MQHSDSRESSTREMRAEISQSVSQSSCRKIPALACWVLMIFSQTAIMSVCISSAKKIENYKATHPRLNLVPRLWPQLCVVLGQDFHIGDVC